MTAVLILLGLISGPNILFVGNSYTNANGGLWIYVKEIYDSLESDTLYVDSHTAGGATFENHWNNQFLLDKLEYGDWNEVVFQEQSCMPVINPSLTYLYGDSLALLAASFGAEPVFLMTWARKNDPIMLEGLQLAYSRMGFVNNSTVAPCGLAFDAIRRKHQEINPYIGDGAHPSVHGTYLAACVIAITVYDCDISSVSVWKPEEIAAEEAEILRLVAMQTCTAYQQPSAGEQE